MLTQRHRVGAKHEPVADRGRYALVVAGSMLIVEDVRVLGWFAPTDYDWRRFLTGRPEIKEVNFWTPGGTSFRAVPAGCPFFFKLKRQPNATGAFGLFARFARLPVARVGCVRASERGP